MGRYILFNNIARKKWDKFKYQVILIYTFSNLIEIIEFGGVVFLLTIDQISQTKMRVSDQRGI